MYYFPLLIFTSFRLFSASLATQNNNVEEANFTQCLVRVVVTNESEFDPVPFKPYIVINKPPPNLDPARPDCDCGVHTFVDSNKNQKLLKSEESFHNSPSLWVDGPYTDKNQFPFIVALIYRKTNVSATHFCGGTLLTNKLIVTATHCLAGKRAEKTEVWLNERDLLLSTETDHPTLKIKVERFIPHPEYNPLMNYNDISLIELSEPVDVLKNHLRPICLPIESNYEPTEHVSFGFTAGWGQTQFNGPKSDHLRHVQVPLITNKACNEESEPYYRGRVTSHMLCAGDLQKGGPDACPGDSGGPLFVKHKERYRLIGVVSFGERCSEARKPGVYTRVSKYLRWIRKISAETDRNEECMDEFKFQKNF